MTVFRDPVTDDEEDIPRSVGGLTKRGSKTPSCKSSLRPLGSNCPVSRLCLNKVTDGDQVEDLAGSPTPTPGLSEAI